MFDSSAPVNVAEEQTSEWMDMRELFVKQVENAFKTCFCVCLFHSIQVFVVTPLTVCSRAKEVKRECVLPREQDFPYFFFLFFFFFSLR